MPSRLCPVSDTEFLQFKRGIKFGFTAQSLVLHKELNLLWSLIVTPSAIEYKNILRIGFTKNTDKWHINLTNMPPLKLTFIPRKISISFMYVNF